MAKKPYTAKTISGAQAYARSLIKQVEYITRLLEEAHEDRVACAKLSADGPAFDNPIVIAKAKEWRNKILKMWCKLNPDGTRIKAPGGAGA
jgi:hypothetical protein